MTGARLGYVPAFDGLRALAVGLVLVTHGVDPFVAPGGFGVDMFFVLSGFLITTLLWQESERSGRIALGKFYLRRVIRLYPALVTMLGFSLVVGLLVVGDLAGLLRDSFSGLFYLTPITDRLFGHGLVTGHLWTLALEEYFYIVWPPVLILGLRLGMSWRSLTAMLVVVAVLLYGVRFGFALRGTELHEPRVAGIALGCAAALVIANTAVRGNPRWLWPLGLAGLVLAWFTSLGGRLVDAPTPAIAALATVALIFAIMAPASSLAQRFFELRPLTYLGQISYEIYLWHVPVLVFSTLLTGLDRVQLWWWAYPITIGLSAATHAAFLPLQKRWRRSVATSTIRPSPTTSRHLAEVAP